MRLLGGLKVFPLKLYPGKQLTDPSATSTHQLTDVISIIRQALIRHVKLESANCGLKRKAGPKHANEIFCLHVPKGGELHFENFKIGQNHDIDFIFNKIGTSNKLLRLQTQARGGR